MKKFMAVMALVAMPALSHAACSESVAENLAAKHIEQYMVGRAFGPARELLINSSRENISGVDTIIVLARYDYPIDGGHTSQDTCYEKFNPTTCEITEKLFCLSSFKR